MLLSVHITSLLHECFRFAERGWAQIATCTSLDIRDPPIAPKSVETGILTKTPELKPKAITNCFDFLISRFL